MATCCRLWRWSPRRDLGLGRPKLSARQSRSCPSNLRSASERRKPPLAGHCRLQWHQARRQQSCRRRLSRSHPARLCRCRRRLSTLLSASCVSASPWLNEHVHSARSDNLADLSSRRPDGHRVPANGDSPSHAWLVPVQPVRCSEFRQFHSGDFVPVPPRY